MLLLVLLLLVLPLLLLLWLLLRTLHTPRRDCQKRLEEICHAHFRNPLAKLLQRPPGSAAPTSQAADVEAGTAGPRTPAGAAGVIIYRPRCGAARQTMGKPARGRGGEQEC